jgi:hypothetical protein
MSSSRAGPAGIRPSQSSHLARMAAVSGSLLRSRYRHDLGGNVGAARDPVDRLADDDVEAAAGALSLG